MDVGWSLLDQACVRVALLPLGSNLAEDRFDELSSLVAAWREIPLNVLPRRTVGTRSAFTSASGNATYSGLPSELRGRTSRDSESSSRFLSRTFSSRDTSTPSKHTNDLSGKKSKLLSSNTQISGQIASQRTGFSEDSRTESHRVRHRFRAQALVDEALKLDSENVDSLLRLRYCVIPRTVTGDYAFVSSSNWESFHSRRVWGVIGIVDCTEVDMSVGGLNRESFLREAQIEFIETLKHFPTPCVSRIIVFTTAAAAAAQGASVINSPTLSDRPIPLYPEPGAEIVFGYVPETTVNDTLQEVRVQVIHFSELLLNVLDRESWRKEKSSNDLFLTPIDEAASSDKHPKLLKRRAGRLDKLLADGLLLMGSPVDAAVKYASAIEKAKANSDRLWLAGAMEGASTAAVLNHVKDGGHLEDSQFLDKLDETYSEIYKLYNKKRVPELEASAALRFAQFLGKYTQRKRQAIEASDHAAAIGETLCSVKRATLWQALANFAVGIGCRRKAAFYLYRVGNLCASKSVWASSEYLLTNAASLFGTKASVWPDLRRNLLLEAGKAAWELGDTQLASQHYVHALALSSMTLRNNAAGDARIVKLVSESCPPRFIAAACKLLTIIKLEPVRMPELVVHDDRTDESSVGMSLGENGENGPFIYNPFEAAARRKRAAAASKTVPWVCLERARVNITIVNNTHAHLPLEIVSVVVIRRERRNKFLEEFGFRSEQRSRDYESRIRDLLNEINCNADTFSENVTLPKSGSPVEIAVSVVPKAVGDMEVCGIVVRIFRGALVLLKFETTAETRTDASRLRIMSRLPLLSIAVQQDNAHSDQLETPTDSAPYVIFEGERRKFVVRVTNIGPDTISTIRSTVFVENSNCVKVTEMDQKVSEITARELSVGSTVEYALEVAGNCKYQRTASGEQGVASLIVALQYSGTSSPSLLRETRGTAFILVRTAVRVRSLTIFQLPSVKSELDCHQGSFGIIMDVQNLFPAPVTVSIPSIRNLNSAIANIKESWMVGSNPPKSVLECGASSRLITSISMDLVPSHNRDACPLLALTWAVPGVGRYGHTNVYYRNVKIAEGSKCSIYNFSPPPFMRIMFSMQDEHQSPSPRSVTENEEFMTLLPVRTCYRCTATVLNETGSSLPDDAVLDVYVLGHDDRGCTHFSPFGGLIGAVKCVRIGTLRSGDSFEHNFKLRFSSAGLFQLCAIVRRICDSENESNYEELSLETDALLGKQCCILNVVPTNF